MKTTDQTAKQQIVSLTRQRNAWRACASHLAMSTAYLHAMAPRKHLPSVAALRQYEAIKLRTWLTERLSERGFGRVEVRTEW